MSVMTLLVFDIISLWALGWMMSQVLVCRWWKDLDFYLSKFCSFYFIFVVVVSCTSFVVLSFVLSLLVFKPWLSVEVGKGMFWMNGREVGGKKSLSSSLKGSKFLKVCAQFWKGTDRPADKPSGIWRE
jgi:hypothetical protein